MPKKELDLVMALGMPEGGKKSTAGKEKGSSYLDSKSPRLRAFLMDAVDASLSHEERAEALCRAMEESSSAPEEEVAEEDYSEPEAEADFSEDY